MSVSIPTDRVLSSRLQAGRQAGNAAVPYMLRTCFIFSEESILLFSAIDPGPSVEKLTLLTPTSLAEERKRQGRDFISVIGDNGKYMLAYESSSLHQACWAHLLPLYLHASLGLL